MSPVNAFVLKLTIIGRAHSVVSLHIKFLIFKTPNLINFPNFLDIYMNYQEPCTTYLCNPSLYLTCSTTQTLGCSCSSGQTVCDCISTHYWNGAACVPNYSCYSSVSVPCSSGSCSCVNINKYWVGSICCKNKYFI